MILVDAGPLIALLDRSDVHHQRCMDVLAQLANQDLVTTWACLTDGHASAGTLRRISLAKGSMEHLSRRYGPAA